MRSFALAVGLAAAAAAFGFAAEAATPAKPAPRPAAAKPAAAKPAAGAFDARDPASLIDLLSTMGAKGEIVRTNESDVFMKVSTPGFAFTAQYVDCDAKGRACGGVAFSTFSEQGRSTLAQLNAFNQTSISCRVFDDQAGKPHVMYSALVSRTDTREEMRNHLGVWQGCLSTFGLFLSDPIGYLASAP